jgi:CheY-like chemotaxis protein
MKPYGMQVDCASSGPQTIELIRSEKTRYDAIFMDHMMPGMDGIEATRIIREEIGTEYARNIPIIALTANAIVGNEEMFLAHGFQAFLSKPIDIMAMDVVIRQWVRNKDLEKEQEAGKTEVPNRRTRERRHVFDRRQIDRREVPGTLVPGLDILGIDISGIDIPKIDIPGIDTEKGAEHLGGDWDIYWDVMKSFAQNTPPLLDKIRAFSAEYSAEAEGRGSPSAELNDYAIIVHGIKGSGRSIGAEDLGAKAEALEHAAKVGNVDFIRENHRAFILASDQLIDGLNAEINRVAVEHPKPRKIEPAEETLEDLLQSCRAFDIDGVDRAMEELESCEYETGADLVAWLREKADGMGFKEIAGRLS